MMTAVTGLALFESRGVLHLTPTVQRALGMLGDAEQKTAFWNQVLKHANANIFPIEGMTRA
jgi:hypothetical protein